MNRRRNASPSERANIAPSDGLDARISRRPRALLDQDSITRLIACLVPPANRHGSCWKRSGGGRRAARCVPEEMMKAHEVMNRMVVRLGSTVSVELAAEVMRSEGVGIVCICDEQDRPVGVLTDRDIVLRVCATHRSGETTRLQEVMTPEPLTCGTETELSEVEAMMKRQRLGRVLVVDDVGQLVGIITLAEIWHYENPIEAAPVSRTVTEREFRAQPSGASLPVGGTTHRSFGVSKGARSQP